jgi:hypothetical protein
VSVTGDILDILDGVARLLDGASVGTYRSDGTTYSTSETAITFKDLPPAPDRVIALTAFGASDQPQITLGSRQVQLRARGTSDPRDVDAILDAAFVALHGAENLTFGSVHVVQILRLNTIPLGMDEQDRRWQRADNYMLDVDLPTSTNRPI